MCALCVCVVCMIYYRPTQQYMPYNLEYVIYFLPCICFELSNYISFVNYPNFTFTIYLYQVHAVGVVNVTHDHVLIGINVRTCARAELSKFAMAFVQAAEYKIILLGEPGVGKTNYFFRLRDGIFVGSSVSTVSQGVEHMTFKATVDGDEVKVHIIDKVYLLFHKIIVSVD